jgi:septal ring-binding cell division protein DamX
LLIKYASLCALYDQDSESIAQRETPITIQEEAGEKEDITGIHSEKKSDAIEVNSIADSDTSVPSTQYYAQLIGYGTKKAADSFAQKLQRKGVSVLVKIRRSQTAQGRKTTWYQVVTKTFSDRKALESLTQSIAHDEKIKGIRIITC